MFERMVALYKDSKECETSEKARVKWRGHRLTKKQLAEICECQLALVDAMMTSDAACADLEPLLPVAPEPAVAEEPLIGIQSVFEEPEAPAA